MASNSERIKEKTGIRISPFGGGELKDLGGGSSLGPLGVKNKVSKNLGGGVTDFLGGVSPPPNGPAGNPGNVSNSSCGPPRPL